MNFESEVLAIVLGFMVLANRIVEAMISPIFDRFELDRFWLMYIAWLVSGIFVWLAKVNLFAEFIPNPLIGQILTAITAGGGANLLHDIADQGVANLFVIADEEIAEELPEPEFPVR